MVRVGRAPRRAAPRAAPGIDTARDTLTQPGPTRREWLWIIVMIAAAWVVLFIGWRLFWFITDDAYISFRYVSNSIFGFGYVWNPPPFRPVEGYSNFLWILLLDAAWRWLRLEPPQVATQLSLICSAATLLIVAVATWRLAWRKDLRSRRPLFLGLVLLWIVTNRTFLAWSSSGLETALFNLFLSAWIWGALWLFPAWPGRLMTSFAAAGAALTRPDGMLFVLATIVLHGIARSPDDGRTPRRRWLALAPLLLNLVHLIWRRWFYGAWLPNTYYAKYTGAWPESGLRYVASFTLEYAWWIVGFLAAAVWVLRTRSGSRRPAVEPGSRARSGIVAVTLGALAAQVAYYTLVIGGDHFEYRVLSHLVLWLPVATVWLLQRSRLRVAGAIGVLIASVVLSWPVPWTHWALTHRLRTREQTFQLRMPIAPSWPAPVRGYAAAFDRLQSWLIGHLVCSRHQEHKAAAEWWMSEVLPSRDMGSKLPSDGVPVMVASGGIGGLGWVLPRVCLIDLYGLNDHVIARTPPRAERIRLMAHERVPPPGYVEGFRPNVILVPPHQVRVTPRSEPLTAKEVVEWERTWWKRYP